MNLETKPCQICRVSKDRSHFNSDRSRWDGLYPACRDCQRARSRRLYVRRPRVSRKGQRFATVRGGDKVQARQRVNHMIKAGLLPHPNSLPCSVCGDQCESKRREYHHHKGYDAAHQEDVIVVGSKCHRRMEGKGAWTHCPRGHAFDSENTIVGDDGRRRCLACRRLRDRNRGRDANYWRNYRRLRKESSHGKN